MGCCNSRIEREEMVCRCKGRKRYMKQVVKARHSFSASHSMYLRSLRSTASALLHFGNAETQVHIQAHSSRDPFASTTHEEDEEMAIVVTMAKDLLQIINELHDYFLKAAAAGRHLSLLLELPYGNGNGNGSHCCTVERLYAWEKKLYLEVKNCERVKVEHEKMLSRVRKLEMKRGEYIKTEKTKKQVEKLESQMMVASQTIDSTSAEIIKLRENELYPQLRHLVKGLMGMWRSMYECHQVQTHIVQQLKYLRTIPSSEPTSEIHRQSTLQLELQVQQWHLSFCNLVKAQQDYIQSLTGWLRLSLFQFNKNPLLKTSQESRIYSLSEEFHLAINRIPDKVASEGIKSFLTVINAIVAQQSEEHKQKKKSETAFKELEKRVGELRSLEAKFGPYSTLEASGNARNKDRVGEKRLKVEMLKAKAEEEKSKHDKAVNVTRSMTMNNLQMGFPHVFEAIVGFSSVCMHAFESVYNQSKTDTQEQHELKMILT